MVHVWTLSYTRSIHLTKNVLLSQIIFFIISMTIEDLYKQNMISYNVSCTFKDLLMEIWNLYGRIIIDIKKEIDLMYHLQINKNEQIMNVLTFVWLIWKFRKHYLHSFCINILSLLTYHLKIIHGQTKLMISQFTKHCMN